MGLFCGLPQNMGLFFVDCLKIWVYFHGFLQYVGLFLPQNMGQSLDNLYCGIKKKKCSVPLNILSSLSSPNQT